MGKIGWSIQSIKKMPKHRFRQTITHLRLSQMRHPLLSNVYSSVKLQINLA